MSKDLSMSILMDFYGQLLTEKQFSTLDLYYNQDFSLAEIAQNMDITRQGVRDSIKRGEKQLHDFEERLGLADRFVSISEEFEKLDVIINSLKSLDIPNEYKEKLSELRNISDNIKEIL